MRWLGAVPFAFLVGAWWWPAEDKPPSKQEGVFEYSGKPLVAPYQCSEEDIQSFGLGCTEEEPCPIFLELAAFEPVGNQLFAAGNIHSGSSTLYSVLLTSSDAGKTWREPFARIRGAGLDRILFIDFEHGW